MGLLRGEYATFITKSNSIKTKCQLCNSDDFFLSFFRLIREERIQIQQKRAIISPPAKRHLNGASLVCDDGPILNAGLVAL